MLYDPKRRYTVEEYFEIDAKSEERLQYYRGYIFPKHGVPYQPEYLPTANRAIVTANLIRLLGIQLSESSLILYGSEQRLKLPTEQDFFVSAAASDEIPLCDEHNDAFLVRPSLIVEVENDNGFHVTFGKRIRAASTIPGLVYMLAVSQNYCNVVLYTKDESPNSWKLKFLDELEQTLEIPGINCKISLQEIYAKVFTRDR